MITKERNLFWDYIYNHEHYDFDLEEIIRIIQCKRNLKELLLYAYLTKHNYFRFERNREVIDILNNFRYISYKNRNFILKVVSRKNALREIDNAIKLKEKITFKEFKDISVKIPIPLMVQLDSLTDTYGLLYYDYGKTLYDNLDLASIVFPKENLFSLINKMIEIGVEWRGFLPRNIFITNKNEIILIDLETIRFHNNEFKLDPHTLFTWALGWSQIYFDHPQNIECQILQNIKIQLDNVNYLDKFETTFRELNSSLTPEEVFNQCKALTYKSEANYGSMYYCGVTPMELGHLLDDLFPIELSMLYTHISTLFRTRYSEEVYFSFIENLTKIIQFTIIDCSNNSEQIPKDIISRNVMSTILYLLDDFEVNILVLSGLKDLREFEENLKHKELFSNFFEFSQLKESYGIKNSLYRSSIAEKILSKLFELIKKVYSVSEEEQLIVRGSLGHGLMTIKSDIDFEISSCLSPNGNLLLEDTIGLILSLYGVNWEGSRDRPIEKDFIDITKTISRDMHELSELRVISPNCRSITWIHQLFNFHSMYWWNLKSQYEEQGTKSTIKYLYFEIRSVISRLANKHGFNEVLTVNQLELLKKVITTEQLKLIEITLREIFDLYESDVNTREEQIYLKEKINRIRSQLL